ncbi:MAG: NAD(P) transhydrogenase subunit beta [Bacteroidetes bacterium]|nr:MAG: NAD(P) transhydrogenase subunit beta [Bacteroidota bacterium]
METHILTICYLIASVSFILGLKMLSTPATAKRGNRLAGLGMLLAIAGTIFLYKDENGRHLHNFGLIIVALAFGSVIGYMAAKKVKMTAMPEMVSLFNGMGGACAALISIAEFNHLIQNPVNIGQMMNSIGFFVDDQSFGADRGKLLIILLGLIIGSVSFAGSVIAWGKLNGRIHDYAFKGQHVLNLAILALIIILAGFLWANVNGGVEFSAKTDFSHIRFSLDNGNQSRILFYSIVALALLYGVLFVMPIGGADMPVVISLLNSFTGVAAACGGFLYDNKAMLTGGILVGAAGTLLTILMCKAMNRSLKNVLIGSFGGGAAAPATPGKPGEQTVYKEITISEAAIIMAYSNKLMIVPGYGLAVAQAQHACHELERLLTDKGVEVKYAIHPVAGRMPGHMNVLLAEADVSYDKLLEMESANEEFPTTDIVLVLGANDVVNPAAKTDPSSPIYGMPILEVELAKTVIVNKRSMKPGYAGIENQLFYKPKTSMLFGDAKDVLQQLIMVIKNL